MKYTVEESEALSASKLAGMGEAEINLAVLEIAKESPAFKQLYEDLSINAETMIPDYCKKWAFTGPLMVEYGITPIFENGKFKHAEHNNGPDNIQEVDYLSDNPNPLRAICEVILMMESK